MLHRFLLWRDGSKGLQDSKAPDVEEIVTAGGAEMNRIEVK